MNGAPHTSPSLYNPWVDTFLVGGGSVLLLSGLLLFDVPVYKGMPVLLYLSLQSLINFPHFAASLLLLYRRPDIMRRHPWASYYVPALLFACVVFIYFYTDRVGHESSVWLVHVLVYVGSVYLGVHYTGQTWGMVSTYAHLTGFIPTPVERRLLRTVLWTFLAWHVSIYHVTTEASNMLPFLYPYSYYLNEAIVVAAHASLGLAVLAFVLMGRRKGSMVPLQMILPIVALYMGYLLLQRNLAAGFVYLQMGHSVQYLMFPTRIELNMNAGKKHRALRMVAYVIALLVLGFVLFSIPSSFEFEPWSIAGTAWVQAIAIHHYFVDGCIWKLRQPEVQRDLFQHVNAA